MIACVIIAGQGHRSDLIDTEILPVVLGEGFSEIIVVGTHHRCDDAYRYLFVPDLTKTTNDALVKRDVGTLACRSDVIVYLSDDHTVLPGFVKELEAVIRDAVIPWDVLVPSRWAEHPEQGRIQINNGERESYCGGHGGVFRRRVIQHRPWSAHKHHPNWDLITSHDQQQAGFTFVSYPRLQIVDLEPKGQPWK